MKPAVLSKSFNLLLILLFCFGITNAQTYKIVDTDQSTFFDTVTVMSAPLVGESFYGQDAQYSGFQPSYTNNGDGTVTDNVTVLMWQQTLDHNGDGLINVADKLNYTQILALPNTVTTGGYTDWRVPTIKEQYSLIIFSGRDVSGYMGTSTDSLIPFINKNIFGFNYGDTGAGERIIDVQCASTNVYVGSNLQMVFGVNFADGRIKGYGTDFMGQPKKFNYLLVRGNTDYGINNFTDNGNSTITDNATGLMWTKDDNAEGVIWEDALSYAETSEFAGYTDWRLPNAKELQSIVDYTRSPSTTNSAAIDPLFNCTSIINEAGATDYPFYWSSTTHANMNEGHEGGWGAYVCFGRAMGYDQMTPQPAWTDVHGAGAQRSDPKYGDPTAYPNGNGPQGDAVRIYNYVRLVRDEVTTTTSEILMNEIYSRGTTADPDWIEIYNSSTSAIDISGYKIYDIGGQSGTKPKKEFPSSSVIPANGFLVIATDDTSESAFGLSSSGEIVWLENASGSIIDSVTFPALTVDQSYGRIPDGGVWQILDTITRGISNTALTGVLDESFNVIDYGLSQNYPNPFNPTTMISYSVPTDGFVNLSVYNLIGEKVAQLVNANVRAGNHQVSFDASALTSGVYFYKIETAGFTSVKKMMVLK